MNIVIQRLQRRLMALGFPLPRFGADGYAGDELWAALGAALDALEHAAGGEVPAVVTTSAAGRAAITSREGIVLTAYEDSVGILTIGVGHTSAAGAPVVERDMAITVEEADAILMRDLAASEAAVLAAVAVPLSQTQFDALVSLAFNIGGGAFAGSTLVRKLNAGDVEGAADQFLVWNKAGGRTLRGLVTRRQSERAQFLAA
jgi:lysozyme